MEFEDKIEIRYNKIIEIVHIHILFTGASGQRYSSYGNLKSVYKFLFKKQL